MSQIYDNWERVVRATLRREQLRLSGQRTPSDLSLSSSSSFNFDASSRSSFDYVPFGKLSSRNFPSSLLGRIFEYDEILRATNYFSESNLIKHGRSGDLFSGVLENGTRVVIKRINLLSAEKELYYMSELLVFSKLSNCRLVPLQGHCLENGDEKYLIYKYLLNGDLWSSFYPKVVAFEYVDGSQNWRTRLRIATGLAEALSYLHHQCVPPLVHRDIRASSILLDDDLEVRLCSLGDVCTQEMESNQTRITSFQDLPQGSKQGPFGTSNATCAYDVYCFGKVLLELVTGKLGAAENYSIMNELMNEHPNFIDIIDSMEWINTTLPSMVEARGVAIIAKACLHPESSNRPLMAHVLMALKDPSKVVIAGDMASYSLSFAGPPALVGATVPKTLSKRSKFRRLVLGTLLKTKT